ncbi:hypothetical protein HYQ44_013994 [Verticillium longisporum]|nr:hypothetical protein HYQ44_013994 [Verticillium longisporum]
MAEFECAVPEWLTVPHARGCGEEGFAHEGLGGGVLLVSDQLAQGVEVAVRISGGPILGPAVPDRVFVQLKEFGRRSPIYHAAQPAVADWQGLRPRGCRGIIVKSEVRVTVVHGAGAEPFRLTTVCAFP